MTEISENTDKSSAVAAEKSAAVAAYNSVVEHSQLGFIRLVDLTFSIKPEFYSSEGKRRPRFGCEITDIFYDSEETQSLGGRFIWNVTIMTGKKKTFSCTASYLIIYTNVPNVESRHAEAYLTKVGRFATYPYFRTQVSQLSWASEAELPVMPVLTS